MYITKNKSMRLYKYMPNSDYYDSFFLKCFREEKLLSGFKILGKNRIKIKIKDGGRRERERKRQV